MLYSLVFCLLVRVVRQPRCMCVNILPTVTPVFFRLHLFRLNEKGKPKCNKYWVDEGSRIFASTERSVRVTHLQEKMVGSVTSRVFSILPLGETEVGLAQLAAWLQTNNPPITVIPFSP